MPKKKNRKIFGIPIPISDDRCCLILMATIVAALFMTGTISFNPFPAINTDPTTPTTTDPNYTSPTTTTTPDDDGGGTTLYKVKWCLQWNDGIPSEYKDAIRFNILTALGMDILDYRIFTEEEGDAPFTWYYGVFQHAFDGTNLRIVMSADEHFSFASFSTVVYTSAGPWSSSYSIYYNPIAGSIDVGELYVTWEAI